MLRIKFDVNGRDVAKFAVWRSDKKRTRRPDDGGQEVLEYRYQVFDVRTYPEGSVYVHDYPKVATVWHNKDDGVASLVQAVMAGVEERHFDPIE